MNKKKILVLGAGILQLSTIKKAKELGYYCIAADYNPDAIGLKYADKAIVEDITNKEKMLQIAVKENINGVIHPCSEVASHCMGYINDVLGTVGIGEDVVKKATNKELMRRAFENFGAPSPISITTHSVEECQSVFERLNCDTIIKPSRNSGSRGVSFIKNNAKSETVKDAFINALSQSRDKSVLVEEFVDGPEFSVEIAIWCHEITVLTITDKLTTGKPYFVELGHSQPSSFSEEDIEKIKKAAVEGVKALELNNCVAHAELKLTKNRGAMLIEIGARLGGDFISTELVHLSTGIDMVECAIQIALGEKPDYKVKTAPQGAVIRYLTPEPGIVEAIKNPYINHNDEKIYDIEIYVNIGDIIKPIRSSLDRAGHVITIGFNVDEAISHAERIISNIKIITE